MTEDDEVIIRVQPNSLNDDVMVFIPQELWDYDNIAEAIKKAVIMTTGQLPDELDS